MKNNIKYKVTLNNGVKMPWLGLGVFRVEDGPELVNAVKYAIKVAIEALMVLLYMGMKKGWDKE